MTSSTLRIIKVGGSVLATPSCYERAAELVRELGREHRVAVVVSAQKGHTDALEAELSAVDPSAPLALHALMVSVGEQRSAALLGAWLHRLGETVAVIPPWQVFEVEGPPDAPRIHGIETTAIREALAGGIIPVVPGYVGAFADGRLATFGRGGADLSAVALACALDADRAVLLKGDVDGLYTRDPRVDPAGAVLIADMTHDDALALIDPDSHAIHRPALELARARDMTLQVRGMTARHDGTIVGTRRP